MSDKDDGGPAFPVDMDRYGDRNEGMSLRDYLAGQALIGMGVWVPFQDWNLTTGSALAGRAKWAYAQADHMLEARKHGVGPLDGLEARKR